MAKIGDIGPPPGEKKTAGKAARTQARAERLAAALKSNLRRRKTQACERVADAGGEAGQHPAGPGAPDNRSKS